MSDDYLWDGSGEPDPEVERLERLLRHYSHQPKPIEMPARPRRFLDLRLIAAVAAMLLMALTGLWALGLGSKGGNPPQQKVSVEPDVKSPVQSPAPAPAPSPQITPLPDNSAPVRQIAKKSRARRASPESTLDLLDWGIDENVGERSFPDESAVIAMSPPRDLEMFDIEAAQHIEKAQLLLRAFRNAAAGGRAKAFDVAYEREKSRGLVYKNIVLRRDAEARNNYPVEEVLASLEPLLLDIANLPASPSRDEVGSIVQRIEKMEILATLQVHSGLLAVSGQ